MYRKIEQTENSANIFELPFEGKLCSDNRWVIMASFIPWSEFEDVGVAARRVYAENFSKEMGAPAKSFRMALGALIIKERLGISEARSNRTNQRKPLFTILHRKVNL